MKFGCFGNLRDYTVIENLGFDSIELSLEEICALPGGEFEALRRRAASSPCKPHAVSRLMPLTERIRDAGFDSRQWLEFFRKGAERTAALGSAMWVFGCGKPRSLPDLPQMPPMPESGAAREKIDDFILRTADVLSAYSILLILEPLGSPYSNYIGTVSEAVSFIERYRHKNISAMCDLRHTVNRGESFDDYRKFAAWIRHAHVDCPGGEKRLFPGAADGYDYTGFFDALRQIGYGGILTVEAPDGSFSEAGESLAFLKNSLDNDYNKYRK